MCHSSVLAFGERTFGKELEGKRVLEVGSYDVNGSLRPIVEKFNPSEYIGVDIEMGPRVDQVVPAEKLVETFGKDSFDIVISSEMLEHAEDWRTCVNQMKLVTRDVLIITTRSPGFFYHPYPDDHWRYTKENMRKIFRDFDIEVLEDDPEWPGVFMVATKKSNRLASLDDITLDPPC